MATNQYPQGGTPQQEEEIDLREQLDLYLQRWPWFVGGLLLAVALAFVYLRFATPTYNTTATVVIKDADKGGGGASEMAAFAGMGDMFGGMGTNSIENELGIFRSKRLITKVARELHLNVRYFQEDVLRSPELFSGRPFNVQILNFDQQAYTNLGQEEEIFPWFFTIDSEESYTLENRETGETWKKNFGEAVELPYAQISVTPNFNGAEELKKIQEKGAIKVTIGTVEDAAIGYRNRIQVNLTDKNSSLIELTLEDPLKDKAQRILDQLVAQYNREAIEDKNLVSLNTAQFIEERLQIITQELDSVETGKAAFKTENQLTNIEEESRLFIENASEFRNRQLEVETQLELANTMINFVKNDEEYSLLPSNLGFEDQGVAQVVSSYNELVLERDRILDGSTELNPVIINLTKQIQGVKGSVLQSLTNLRTSLQISKKDLDAQEAKIESQIAAVPSKEKQFRNIERQQNIKEALYLYLLQKREETTLNLAVTAPKAKIVDAAYSAKEPVSPKKPIILLGAGIMGLLVPFLFVYTRNLLSNKVESRKDIENMTREIPIIGEIPKLGRKEEDLVMKNDRSVLAEANRILVTNLQYLFVNGDEEEGRTILTTSTVKGEGKTFVSMNLALTLANMGKSVVLVGADLRNPQLQRYLPQMRKSQGVTEFLANSKLQLEELIQPTDYHEKLDILISGSIPPNPAELWRQGRTNELFASLKERYDYVVIDAAPSLLVTDTFLINQYADLTLYVVRAGVTEKKLLEFPQDAIRETKLHDVAFVLNDVDVMNFGYGNKYGYSYDSHQPSMLERLRGRFSR